MSQQINNPNLNANPGGVSYTPLVLPEIVLPTVPTAPPTTTTSPASYTHMPDGTWADAQVDLSAAATTPTTEPGSAEEQIVQFYQNEMAFENMMFQTNMMQMQARAAASQKAAMAARSQATAMPDVKMVQPPDIRGVDSGDDGGDEGGYEE